MHPSSCVRAIVLLATLVTVPMTGCSTAPKSAEQASFLERANATVGWFEVSVDGLSDQINRSAAYVVFPDVGQWGMLLGGGKFGRGALCRPDGELIGWAAINTLSVGLQAGVQGFRVLVVIEDEATLSKFKKNQLTGSVSGVAVAMNTGRSATARFQNGVAVYEGANTGLIAGVNIGLDALRYEPLEPGDPKADLR